MAKQLTMRERERISQGVYAGESDAAIARRLGRHRSTIGRERRRNGGRDGYAAVEAQARSQERRRGRPLLRKLELAVVREFVCQKLLAYWSPEQIAGYSRRQFRRRRKCWLSHQTIYDWIRRDPQQARWEACLRGGGPQKKYRGPGVVPHPVTLAQRPAIVDRRERLGDWEGDTVAGARQHGCLLTHVDRKSGYLLAALLPDRRSPTVNKATTRLFAGLPWRRRQTLTLDRGSEFSGHEELAALTGLKVYFADPYSPWQRGSNENTNRLLRQYFPKKTDLRKVTPQQVRAAVHALNHRPRKRLNYKTPHEVFTRKLRVAIDN